MTGERMAKVLICSNSRTETEAHIRTVRELLMRLGRELLFRGINHDRSKLQAPEKPLFDRYPKPRGDAYGSHEHKEILEGELRVAIDHHYANNRHHPEHHSDGVRGMNLIDVVEMFIDWLAHSDGDMERII